MSNAKQGSVLCVDDEPPILRSLQRLLQKDFYVKTAVGGEEALRLVKASDFDVVLSDQRMPGMTGAQFLSQVKDISPRSMRLLLTGYSDMPALLSSVNEGEIWQFIKKPWDNKELKNLLLTATKMAQTSAGATFASTVAEVIGGNVLLISDDEDISLALSESLGQDIRIIRTSTLSEAVHSLVHESIGTIVSEARVGTTDIARFLTLVKQKRPEIVSVVLSDGTDGEQLIRLINRGQLYRFANKPFKANYLQFLVKSAIMKHEQLVADPLMRLRYTAAGVEPNLERELMQELGLLDTVDSIDTDGETLRRSANQEAGFMNKLRIGFGKLFGRL